MELNSSLKTGSVDSLLEIYIGNPRKNTAVSTLAKKRTRRSPKRYGAVGEFHMSDSYEDVDELWGDNSFEDKDFVPPENKAPKVVATAIDIARRNSKKKKLDSIVQTSEQIGISADDEHQFGKVTLDLDEEFDSLSKSMPKTFDIGSSQKKNEQTPEKNEKSTGQLLENKDLKSILNICERILSSIEEQKVRISLIEEYSMHNNKSISKDRQMNLVKKTEENRIFTLTNKLPLNNVKDLKLFEDNLNDIEFAKIAVFIIHFLIQCHEIYFINTLMHQNI